jgi:AcrR family transcriptional regulator
VAGGGFNQGDSDGSGKGDPERDRFVAAFAKAAAEHGYRDLTVDQVARYAGTSRARIEAHFGSKEQGIVAAQDAFLARLWLDVLDACDGPEEWPAKVRAALRAVIASIVEANTLARVFAVEATSASFAATARQLAVLDGFATLLREGRSLYPAASSLPPVTERAVVGGIASIISGFLLAEEPQALVAIEPELVELVLVPFVGATEARRIAGG